MTVDKESLNLVEQRKNELKQILPEIFVDGKIDVNKLRDSLGDYVETGSERYSFNWAGRTESLRVRDRRSKATITPNKKESVDFDNTKNIIIEGENLEVLKILQKSYQGKVKMIYIDPPYNTGRDFVYKDDFSDSLVNYLRYTGQVTANGEKTSTNTETSGRYHSKWLSMMYPRLFLGRNLLRDDGVIFVSIDDNEVNNLRLLMNDVFGEECFVSHSISESKQAY
jgi:adenine-specific DNA-methyltransferase